MKMCNDNRHTMVDYIVVGIGDAGISVREKISASSGADTHFVFHSYQKLIDFRKDEIEISDDTRAIYLVLRLGDTYSDESLLDLESFILDSGIPVYAIVNYPFLWEGPVRMPRADQLLKELIRICDLTFRIESHQWFPLKEELGFHKVVDMVHYAAARLVSNLIDLQANSSDLEESSGFSIDEDVEVIKQDMAYWIAGRKMNQVD